MSTLVRNKDISQILLDRYLYFRFNYKQTDKQILLYIMRETEGILKHDFHHNHIVPA